MSLYSNLYEVKLTWDPNPCNEGVNVVYDVYKSRDFSEVPEDLVIPENQIAKGLTVTEFTDPEELWPYYLEINNKTLDNDLRFYYAVVSRFQHISSLNAKTSSVKIFTLDILQNQLPDTVHTSLDTEYNYE